MNKGFEENLSQKITLGKLFIFICLCCCHPELVEGFIEWIVALREPQRDSAFIYYAYPLFFMHL
jgi:hypothetical protein